MDVRGHGVDDEASSHGNMTSRVELDQYCTKSKVFTKFDVLFQLQSELVLYGVISKTCQCRPMRAG